MYEVPVLSVSWQQQNYIYPFYFLLSIVWYIICRVLFPFFIHTCMCKHFTHSRCEDFLRGFSCPQAYKVWGQLRPLCTGSSTSVAISFLCHMTNYNLLLHSLAQAGQALNMCNIKNSWFYLKDSTLHILWNNMNIMCSYPTNSTV